MKTRSTMNLMAFFVGAVFLLIIVAGYVIYTGQTAQVNTLTAVKTSVEPAIDGTITDAGWATAPVTTISLKPQAGVEPKQIKMRALYDAKNVFLAATYTDTTPLKIGETWEYDGTAWRKGSYDDTLAFVWNMNDSIPGFNKKGMGVMTKGLARGDDVFDFTLAGPRDKLVSRKADFWGWCGMPEFYGRGDDMVFKLDQKAVLASPTAVLAVQHDAYLNGVPWIKNEAVVNGQAVPIYKYKEGLTIETTPRPYLEDVVKITDYQAIKTGERAPYVIGIKNATWGGSKDDIITRGKTENGTWTVEFKRLLDTGHDDDIRLVPGKTATFVIIIRDDGKGYAVSAPVTLRFE